MPRTRSKNLVYHYTPAAGIRTDFKRLMNDFISAKTVRFESFSEIWRQRNFGFLCAGRYSDRETREFLERVFLHAVDFFLPPYQFQVRVGGLYLLYAIYVTQPVAPRVKVRLTTNQWKETVQFLQEASHQSHLDVVYVFNRMLEEGAFHFVYTPMEMCEKSTNLERDDDEINLADEMKEERREINRLFNYESMEQLSYLLGHYNQMKINLAGPKSAKPDKSLDVVQGSMVEDLISLLQDFKHNVTKIYKHGSSNPPDSQSGPSTSSQEMSIYEKRQAIKNRLYEDMTTDANPVTSSANPQTHSPNKEHSSKMNKSPEVVSSNDVHGDDLETFTSPTSSRPKMAVSARKNFSSNLEENINQGNGINEQSVMNGNEKFPQKDVKKRKPKKSGRPRKSKVSEVDVPCDFGELQNANKNEEISISKTKETNISATSKKSSSKPCEKIGGNEISDMPFLELTVNGNEIELSKETKFKNNRKTYEKVSHISKQKDTKIIQNSPVKTSAESKNNLSEQDVNDISQEATPKRRKSLREILSPTDKTGDKPVKAIPGVNNEGEKETINSHSNKKSRNNIQKSVQPMDKEDVEFSDRCLRKRKNVERETENSENLDDSIDQSDMDNETNVVNQSTPVTSVKRGCGRLKKTINSKNEVNGDDDGNKTDSELKEKRLTNSCNNKRPRGQLRKMKNVANSGDNGIDENGSATEVKSRKINETNAIAVEVTLNKSEKNKGVDTGSAKKRGRPRKSVGEKSVSDSRNKKRKLGKHNFSRTPSPNTMDEEDLQVKKGRKPADRKKMSLRDNIKAEQESKESKMKELSKLEKASHSGKSTTFTSWSSTHDETNKQRLYVVSTPPSSQTNPNAKSLRNSHGKNNPKSTSSESQNSVNEESLEMASKSSKVGEYTSAKQSKIVFKSSSKKSDSRSDLQYEETTEPNTVKVNLPSFMTSKTPAAKKPPKIIKIITKGKAEAEKVLKSLQSQSGKKVISFSNLQAAKSKSKAQTSKNQDSEVTPSSTSPSETKTNKGREKVKESLPVYSSI